ncbi:MAG: hypothetical protein ACLQVY_25440 [Limisphaerales bacterium]
MKTIPKAPLIAGGAVLAVIFLAKVFGSVLDLERPDAIAVAILSVLALVIAACCWLFINLPPTCESRVCRPKDYSVIGRAQDLGIPGFEPVLQCRCGHRYLRRANRFFSISSRNYLQKYMVKLNWYSRWKPDRS